MEQNKPSKHDVAELSKLHKEFTDLAIKFEDKNFEVKALTEQVEKLKNDLLDALDLKQGNGPTALTMLSNELSRLREERKELMKTFRRLLEHCTKTNNFNQFDGILGEIRYVLSKFPEVPNE